MSKSTDRWVELNDGKTKSSRDQLAEAAFLPPWHAAEDETPNHPDPHVRDAMSDVYLGLLPEFFDQPFEPEQRATCSDCAMCSSEDPTVSGLSRLFKPDVKCCTYHPFLPNYQLGALLADDQLGLEEGQRRVRARIGERHGVVPQGIGAPPAYNALYQNISDAGGFGRSSRMLCPYFVHSSGSCSVWPYREAVCSTFFCKTDRGADGQAFWTQLKKYQAELQDTLITYALIQLDWNPERIPRPEEPPVTAEELDGEPPDARSYGTLWGDWIEREEELYINTFEIVRRLTPADIERIGGVRLQIELKRLVQRYERIYKPKTLPVLKRNPKLRVERDQAGRYLLTGYSPLDPSRVRKAVLDAVDAFDGLLPTAKVIESLSAEGRPVPPETLVRSLYQHRILIDAGQTDGD